MFPFRGKNKFVQLSDIFTIKRSLYPTRGSLTEPPYQISLKSA